MTAREFATLDEALAAHGIPPENHGVIRKITDGIGIVRYVGTSGYIKAERRDGAPALNIHSGWTNGFRSRAEVVDALGDWLPVLAEDDIWPSGRSRGQWGITHPAHGHWGGGVRNDVPSIDNGVCPVCFLARAHNGSCGCG
ncbi:MAG: hypothetical protein ACT4P1_03175 [Sporichthyaceae bacterium]